MLFRSLGFGKLWKQEEEETLTDGQRKQSIDHLRDIQHPRQIVELFFEKGTTGGVPALKWQQEIGPAHLLC